MWVVGSDHHHFWIGTEDWARVGLGEHTHIGGLLMALPKRCGASVMTKVHTGMAHVDVHYHHTRPELDLNPWEDADLIVIDSPLGDLCVLPIGGDGDCVNEIVPHPGIYAVCCSARGRDDANEDDDEDHDEPSVEFYRFDIWPAELDETNRTLKRTSEWSTYVLKYF